MPFDSINFWSIFLFAFTSYWILPSRLRNLHLLGFSYFFYGYWDYRFLLILLVSTVIDYCVAFFVQPGRTSRVRFTALAISLITNLGMLAFFKYFNFFIESFRTQFLSSHEIASNFLVNFGVPIGISFYTFQTISYVLDVFKGRVPPARSFIDFALYVAFFPQLVAGPIERARRLLPQIQKARPFEMERLKLGGSLILLGLCKKVFMAESLRHPIETIAIYPEHNLWITLAIGLMTTFQVYLDFAGYSDIARGLAQLFGIEIVINFKPFMFVTNPSQFWQRWHISLTSWIREYLIISFRDRTWPRLVQYLHILMVLMLVGLWHDATWNWILFGLFHGVALIGYDWLRRSGAINFIHPVFATSGGFVFMIFVYIVSGLLHFSYYHSIPWSQETDLGAALPTLKALGYYCLPLLVPLVTFEYFQNKKEDYEYIVKAPMWARIVFVAFTLASVFFFERASQTGFIYFDF